MRWSIVWFYHKHSNNVKYQIHKKYIRLYFQLIIFLILNVTDAYKNVTYFLTSKKTKKKHPGSTVAFSLVKYIFSKRRCRPQNTLFLSQIHEHCWTINKVYDFVYPFYSGFIRLKLITREISLRCPSKVLHS